MSHEILIIVQGGSVQEVYGIPPEIVVRVKDYDVDGADDADLKQDRDGERYCEAVWTHEDSCGPNGTESPAQ
jgi:hypothetical protein